MRCSPHVRFFVAISTMSRWTSAGMRGLPAMAGLEAPEEAKGISMPPHERLGPHNRQKLPPFDDLSEQGECDSRDVVRAARPDLAFDVTGELLSEKQIFGRQLRLGPKHQPQQAQQVSEEGECRRNTCADNTVCNQSPSVSLVGGRATECFLRSTGLLAGDARRRSIRSTRTGQTVTVTRADRSRGGSRSVHVSSGGSPVFL